MFTSKFRVTLSMLILCSFLISACGGNGNTTNEAGSSGETAAGADKPQTEAAAPTTRKMDTIHGPIEYPADPQRIVVDAYLPTLLLLGEKPVGATAKDLENVHIQDRIAGIESTGENSTEKILELNPDLIISANSDPEVFEKLSKIAPTVILPYETYRSVHEEVEGLGAILGKEVEAKEWLADFDKKIEGLRAKVNGVIEEGETFSIFGAFGKTFYLYGDGIYRGGLAIYKELQLTPPATIQKELIDANVTYKEVSLEVLNDYAGDYIFFDESNGAEMDKKDKVWTSIEAVKQDRVFYLDAKRFWPFDPIAVLAQAEEVTEMIVSQKEKENAK
ncbi:ABC transporter substrate-binding protein [Paenibacillus sp. LC231]|uniref:ABC transporter substrate-binding protein n=1 Tax=Paenibacillus sp. LC231 TaxID=1120679 RepID=UPI0008DD173B|nr:ABC transporter substrate-binding protein [Paenibacillus sp. LC231]OIB02976.1 ABC transporter substrate-binding protein [Paenibacillus sp. LC231]